MQFEQLLRELLLMMLLLDETEAQEFLRFIEENYDPS